MYAPIITVPRRLVPVRIGSVTGVPIRQQTIVKSNLSDPPEHRRQQPSLLQKATAKLNRIASGIRARETSKEKAMNSLSLVDLRLLLQNINPEIILSLIIGLEAGLKPGGYGISANHLLLQSISVARKQEDLLAVGLALRYQANPNMYTYVQGLGHLHIFGYAYQQLTNLADTPVLNSIIVMLYVSGSKTVFPAISDNGGGIKYQETRELESQPSIQEWLGTEGYPSILPSLRMKLTNISSSLLIEIGILLDRVDLITMGENRLLSKRDSSFCESVESTIPHSLENTSQQTCNLAPKIWPDISLESIIKSHSNRVLINLKNGKRGDEFYLSWETGQHWYLNKISHLLILQISLDNLNFISFKFFLEEGYLPDYLTINQTLLKYKEFRENRNGVALTAIGDILDESVKMGIQIDPYQYHFLLQIDPSASHRILKEYQEPYWQKICRIEMKLPVSVDERNTIKIDELTEMAFNLGLPMDSDRKSLCRELSQISIDNPSKLENAAIRRQVNRVAADVSIPEEYLKGVDQKGLLCRNRALDKLKGKNPYAYNDIDLAFYRSRDGAVWCYTSDEFSDLLSDQVNPITREKLPSKLLTEMKHKQNQTAAMGISPRDPANLPLTYREGLQKLHQVDTVNNKKNKRIEDSFFKMAEPYGVVKENVNKLTRDEAEFLLKELTEESNKKIKRRVELAPLDSSYARMTFIRVGYKILFYDLGLIPSFFGSIKMITSTKNFL